MIRPIALLLMLSVAASAATPSSIAGKVYRERYGVPSLRTAFERTIVFRDDGRFTFLRLATLNTVSQHWAGGRVLLIEPPGDGTYTYRSTGESTARIALNYDNGSSGEIPLIFMSAWTGWHGSNPRAPDAVFALTDLAATPAAPVTNLSMRGRVSPGTSLSVGFVVPGVGATAAELFSPTVATREVMIRVVGPSLTQFNVADAWADPDFRLYQGSAPAITNAFHYGDWSSIDYVLATPVKAPNPLGVAALKKIFGYVGAFPLLENSKDAVDVVRLQPGAYTIVASPAAGDTGGEVLIEIYFLP
jgi:hypothetical protein